MHRAIFASEKELKYWNFNDKKAIWAVLVRIIEKRRKQDSNYYKKIPF